MYYTEPIRTLCNYQLESLIKTLCNYHLGTFEFEAPDMNAAGSYAQLPDMFASCRNVCARCLPSSHCVQH
jgi:hypothetical protein